MTSDTKNVNIRKTIALLLVLSIICSILVSAPITASAGTNVNKEDLITKVTNPSNATITFTLNVPANTTVSYKVELKPNGRTGAVDTISGSVKNSENKQVAKKVSVKTYYYSNKYTITASYSTGPARDRTNYSDVDNATSALKTTIYTSKFTWDEANVKKWQNAQAVVTILKFAATGAVNIVVKKKQLPNALATAFSVVMFAGDLISVGTTADVKDIVYTPIKGWGYKFKLVPYNGGYTKYLVIIDDKGELYKTINWGKVSISQISVAAR